MSCSKSGRGQCHVPPLRSCRKRILCSVATTKAPCHAATSCRRNRSKMNLLKKIPARLPETDKRQTPMRPRCKSSRIREIKNLRDQKTAFASDCFPQRCIARTAQAFIHCRVHVMTQACQSIHQTQGKILVWLNPIMGTAGTGRSSRAETAAKAMAARMSASDRAGKSRNISSKVAPSSKLARTVRRSTRVPLITGAPPQTEASCSICFVYGYICSLLYHRHKPIHVAPIASRRHVPPTFRHAYTAKPSSSTWTSEKPPHNAPSPSSRC